MISIIIPENTIIKVYVYDCKDFVLTYDGVTQVDLIMGGKEAERIEYEFGVLDERHEYIVIHFEDDRTATFRNSHVDVFLHRLDKNTVHMISF